MLQASPGPGARHSLQEARVPSLACLLDELLSAVDQPLVLLPQPRCHLLSTLATGGTQPAHHALDASGPIPERRTGSITAWLDQEFRPLERTVEDPHTITQERTVHRVVHGGRHHRTVHAQLPPPYPTALMSEMDDMIQQLMERGRVQGICPPQQGGEIWHTLGVNPTERAQRLSNSCPTLPATRRPELSSTISNSGVLVT